MKSRVWPPRPEPFPKAQGGSGSVTLGTLGMGFWVDFISCYKETRAGKEVPLCRPITCSSGSVRCPRWPAAQALPELHTFLCRGVPVAPKVPQAPVFHPIAVASCLHTCSSMWAHLGPHWPVLHSTCHPHLPHWAQAPPLSPDLRPAAPVLSPALPVPTPVISSFRQCLVLRTYVMQPPALHSSQDAQPSRLQPSAPADPTPTP